MPWIVRVALRNLSRNRRRSVLTCLAVMVGTAMLTLALSWVQGVIGTVFGNASAMAGEVRIATPEYVLREAQLPLYENIADVEPVLEAIGGLEGVRAYAVIRTMVTATVGEEIGEHHAMIVGAGLGHYEQVLELPEAVAEGTWFTGEGHEALLGRIVANDLEAHAGDELVVLGMTQDGSISPLKLNVAGIVEVGNGPGDKVIYTTLERARWLADMEGGATEVMAYGSDFRLASQLAERIRALPVLEGLQVQPWLARDPYSTLVRIFSVFVGILSAIIVFITSMVVLNTMLMSVLERAGEIGVLRAMGMARFRTVTMFVLEAMFLGGTGSALGVMLGSIPARVLEIRGVDLGDEMTAKVDVPIASVVHADLTWEIALWVFLLGFVVAVVGSALPALRAASVQPVEAMRRRK